MSRGDFEELWSIVRTMEEADDHVDRERCSDRSVVIAENEESDGILSMYNIQLSNELRIKRNDHWFERHKNHRCVEMLNVDIDH